MTMRPIPMLPPAPLAVLLLAALLALGAAGCATTGRPRPIDAGSLAEAQTFPYYKVYWVGRSFQGSPLAAADGLRGYNAAVGDSVYYGDCVQHKGIFGGGSCILPLQLTTVLYRLHSNATLGPQRNVVIRGVPATGLAAAHSSASNAASSARPRRRASTAASANDTPSANVSRPIHTSATAATANKAAPQPPERPYTPSATRWKSAAEASTDRHALSCRPSSAASGGNSRL